MRQKASKEDPKGGHHREEGSNLDPKRSRIAQQLDVPSRIGKVYFPAVGDAVVEIVAKFGLITHHVGKRGVIVEK
jgi:hypothetical protein